MLEDKKRSTDWEATYDAIEEAVARESYLTWLRENEKRSLPGKQAGSQVSRSLSDKPLICISSIIYRGKTCQ